MRKPQSLQNLKVLFIGNSFTGRNDLPGLLTAIAASGSPPRKVETSAVLANGASLRQHWNAGKALEELQQGDWNHVVLQEQSTLPIKNPTRFHENVRLFDAAIKEHNANTGRGAKSGNDTQITLYLTWARQHAPESQAALTEATYAIAEEIGAFVVPVGLAWQSVVQDHPAIPLYDKDGSHPAPAGSYLAACVFYASLFQQSPVGLAVPDSIQVSEEAAAALQQAAWNTAWEAVTGW